MNDELLMSFIDGKLSDEEMNTIAQGLNMDDNSLREWIIMAHAARMADTAPAQELSKKLAAKTVKRTLENKATIKAGADRRIMGPNLRFIYGLTAIAASVAIVLTFFILPENDVDTTNNIYVAQHVETDSKVEVVDDSVNESAGSKVNNKVDNSKPQVAEVTVNSKIDNVVTPTTEKNDVLTPAIQYDSHAAIQENVEHGCVMIRPAKSPYRVKVKNLARNFEFEWEAENVKTVQLTIKDAGGIVLIEKTDLEVGKTKYQIPVADMCDKGMLQWELTITFLDEYILSRSGVIELVSVLE